MPTLRPFRVRPTGHAAYLEALRAALDGTGPALLPYAGADAAPERDWAETDLPDGLALVVSTSGSTGRPKRAMLTAGALIASADATHERLGGPGQWLLPMPAHHIAGSQVLIRSVRAGEQPVTLPEFSLDAFTDAAEAMSGGRRYTALVPTQLRRLLDQGRAALLADFDGILLGGAASPPALLQEARRAGISLLTTYGMSETAGGCVYDGRPLRGTTVELDPDGRILLGGPTIATGYLADPGRTGDAFLLDGARRFRTDDLGSLDDGVLQVLGRIDDLITTGGLKVAPRIVEEAAAALPQIGEAVAVATPDPEWGHAVSLAITCREATTLERLRDDLRASLPAYALPRRLLTLATIPTRGPGKPDRAAIAAMSGWQDLP
ncbi:o-succinylbenzoate--CoA ligase [Leekyejoonella antrihumi]|uniref:o-succinylbenzoate--CoA ligase n=1 Tax=Leekyejoonella antrihumi TaxID=1660198 RepID=UPI001FE9E1C1|nr:o-succinylbenzoate--CoA ligase [Leekyejoonella antrihumi]